MSDESPVFEKIPVGAGELFTLRVDNINDFNGINVVPHFHMMDELMWFRESEGSYSIGDEKFTIKNNTLVFVPALLIHEMTLPAAAPLPPARFLLVAGGVRAVGCGGQSARQRARDDCGQRRARRSYR